METIVKKIIKKNYKNLYYEKCREFDELKKKFDELEKKINPIPKGKLCSINGNQYEDQVYNVVNKCKINNKLFNTQKNNELGGSTISTDLLCNYNTEKDIGIEIKKLKSPDWVQCSINFDLNKNIVNDYLLN